MSSRPVLSVDFGTTKSYFSKCPANDPSPVSIDFGDGRDGIPSAILYREGKMPLIGQTALDEYGDAAPGERNEMRLVTNFKADLPSSERARSAAADFLEGVLSMARSLHLDLEPGSRMVLFGVPCESDSFFRSAVREAARKGGFGTPELVEEPKGALLYHLKQGDIPVAKALEGVLVVDFGGGTCDFAFLQGGRAVHAWGDMSLGGRLFDDLFFQWFLDSNPGLEEELEAKGSAYFVHSLLCREVKEFFSRTMARDRTAAVSKVLPGYGRFRDMRWEEFLMRGRNYSPSVFFNQAWEAGAIPSRMDLFGRFKECLASGMRQKRIDPRKISLVILAGGSSLWPFVPDIIRGELSLPSDASSLPAGPVLLRSERPYTVISMGLAMLPALTERFAAIRMKLSAELPRFLRDEAGPALTKRCTIVKDRILAESGNEFFRKKIRPLFEEFRKEGGSLASLRRRLSEVLAAEEPFLRQSMESNFPLVISGLREEIRKLTAVWFSGHGIVAPGRDFSRTSQEENTEKGIISIGVPGIDGVLDILGGILGGIVTAGSAFLCGGSGTALLTAGPVGMAAGGIAGLSISWLLMRYGRKRVKGMAEEIALPPWLAAAIVAERRITGAEKELEKAMEKYLEIRLSSIRKDLEDHVRTIAADEIKALSEIGGF
ncbi:MAG: hypothetical protein EOM17_05915 [Synergistales bacterium]|nr:hypothetical protein [Synergistales bacterium]